MDVKRRRFAIAVAMIFFASAGIFQIVQKEEEEITETFNYDDPKIRVTSENQTIHSIPSKELLGGLVVEPPLPDGIRMINNTEILTGNLIDSYRHRTCAISPSIGVNCWKMDGVEVGVVNGFENGSRIFSSIAVGSEHVCAIEMSPEGSKLFCWGVNLNGQVGNDSQAFPRGYEEILHPEGNLWDKVEAGEGHTCALDDVGGIYCWGQGRYGQLGYGGWDSTKIPTKVKFESGSMVEMGLEKVTDIEAGGHHNCAISSLGKIYCWGWNGLGQLGLGFYSNINTPMKVSSPSGFSASKLSLGLSHSCAEDQSGLRVICWGGNQLGQIDSSGNLSYSEPIEFNEHDGIVGVIAGDSHTCLHSANGNISCLGEIDLTSPISSDDIVFHSSGEGYICIISLDKKISCHGSAIEWDMNAIPSQISGMKVVSEVLAGTIVGSHNQNISSTHLIRESSGRGLASEISIKIEFGNDSDGDGWNDFDEKDCGVDSLDANSFPRDLDDDGVCDSNDWDDDGDFVADVIDVFPFDSEEWRDDDGDGIGRNADSIEITGAMYGATITLSILLFLALLEIRATFLSTSE